MPGDGSSPGPQGEASMVAESEHAVQADLSRKAISLARYIERLPIGDYVFILHKKDQSWQVSVMDAQELRTMDLYR